MSSERIPQRLSPTRRQVVAEIVRLTIPDYPGLDDGERARVLASVMTFVTAQIEALPSFLAVPYRIVITVFWMLPILRFGKTFPSLDDPSKQSYLALWSDARFGPFRDFIKLIRSCALLAYFDHPDVTPRLPAMKGERPSGIVGSVADVS